MAIPQAAAANIAPGYTAEVMRRKAPWLTGLGLAVLAALLFWLSTASPDAQAALGAGMLTAGGFSAVWWVSRLLITSADYLTVSKRQARFIRHAFWKAIRQKSKFDAAWLKPKYRTSENILLIGQPQNLQFLAGFMRHLNAGITSNIEAGRPSAAVPFFEEMVTLYVEFARKSNGRVGGSNGPVQILLSASKEIVLAGHSKGNEFDRTAQHCVTKILALATASSTEIEFSASRTLVTQALADYIELTWKNDKSLIPATAASALGEAVKAFISARAYEDAIRTMESMKDLTLKAVVDDRRHISLSCVEGAIGTLPVILATDDRAARDGLLAAYVEILDLMRKIRPALRFHFNEPTSIVFPGIALGQKGLQHVLWDVKRTEEAMSSAERLLLPWIGRALQEFSVAEDEDTARKCVEDSLALLLCVALWFSSSNVSPPRAQKVADTAVSWMISGEHAASHRRIILTPDIAELLWSCLLAAAYGARKPEILRAAAGHIKSLIESEPSEGEFGTYIIDFIKGVYVGSGATAADADKYMKLRPQPYGPRYDGIHLDGFGNAPSMNRNATVNPPQLIDTINAWAITEFPGFISGDVTQEPSSPPSAKGDH
ncbi:hypothetical protein ITP53_39030 [Nonomuraea sp. K274]|uniref:Uncharacterized protein n=1 Tax=Nonomuraea cypriaca TaxID=1187855 RepID=A0A931F516_9ACTN|nr:hypothetical protein [Nonomuraea cypriaca]MBF8191588.1 hypothetical protein [Nonomuraea cypriaca]